MKFRSTMKKLGAAAPLILVAPMAFAQTAQPDTTDAIAYVAAGVATYLAIYNAKYIIGGVSFIAKKVMSAFGR